MHWYLRQVHLTTDKSSKIRTKLELIIFYMMQCREFNKIICIFAGSASSSFRKISEEVQQEMFDIYHIDYNLTQINLRKFALD